MSFTVKAVGRARHYCPCPGVWARFRHGLKTGAVVVCDECGTHWQWRDTGDGHLWVRCDPDCGLSQEQRLATYGTVSDENAPLDQSRGDGS